MNPDYVQALQTSPHFPTDVTYRLFPSDLAYLIDDLYSSTQLPLELIFNTVLATLSLSCQSLVDVVHPGTVAKLAMRQPFVLFKGLTFQKLCLPGAFRPGDHHNKMLRPGLCVVHASPQYL